MGVAEIATLFLSVLVITPITVYFSVKLGTYAYLEAHRLFRKKNQGVDDGDEA